MDYIIIPLQLVTILLFIFWFKPPKGMGGYTGIEKQEPADMSDKEYLTKETEPKLIKAGDVRVLLGIHGTPPRVDCRVVAEDYYQEMLKGITYLKEKHQELYHHKIDLLRMNQELTQQLIDEGLEEPAVKIDFDQSHEK